MPSIGNYPILIVAFYAYIALSAIATVIVAAILGFISWKEESNRKDWSGK